MLTGSPVGCMRMHKAQDSYIGGSSLDKVVSLDKTYYGSFFSVLNSVA